MGKGADHPSPESYLLSLPQSPLSFSWFGSRKTSFPVPNKEKSLRECSLIPSLSLPLGSWPTSFFSILHFIVMKTCPLLFNICMLLSALPPPGCVVGESISSSPPPQGLRQGPLKLWKSEILRHWIPVSWNFFSRNKVYKKRSQSVEMELAILSLKIIN